MKKIVLSLALASVTALGFAQSENMEAFKHMSVGVEAGLMGAGVQVAMPVVTDHLVLVLGYNSFKYSMDKTIEGLGYGDLNNHIAKLNQQVSDYNTYVSPFTGQKYSPLSSLGQDISVDASAELNLSNFKCLVEYYPSKNSSFHLTAGVMIGKDYLLKIDGVADKLSNDCYKSALKLNEELKNAPFDDPGKKAVYDITGVDDLDKVLRLNVDDQTYHLGTDASVEAKLAINKVRPYFGLGFGRAVPNKRVGFQFEIGAWMHGNPTLKSANNLGYFDPDATSNETVDDVYKIVNSVSIWPQMTFRLTGRIF